MSIDNFIEPEEAPQAVVPQKTEKTHKTVSFSQYAMWLKCPMQWKLASIDKLKKFEDNINTVFGSAIHEVLQEYLRRLYTVSVASADEYDVQGEFVKKFEEGVKTLPQATEAQLALPPEELDELDVMTPKKIDDFCQDGKTILAHVTSYSIRSKHFPSKKYELVGIELPLEVPMKGGTIMYKGYLDVVFRDKATKKILILDFKTSTFGWNKWQKADRTKIDQLLLYKRFYNQIFKVPLSDIEVEFFVVKRKLYEDVPFPQQRIQRISPPDGKLSIKEVETSFLEFINSGFDKDGKYNVAGPWIKNPGKARKNCKYCEFKTLKNDKGELYCDGKED